MKTAASVVLQKLLATERFPGMSGKMRGIVRCILGRDDGFAELCITSDGFLLGRMHGDVGFNEFLGAESNLAMNWTKLLDVTAAAVQLPLTTELRREAEEMFKTNILWF